MLLWEKEYNRIRIIFKILIFILIALLALFIVYYVVFFKNYFLKNDKIQINNRTYSSEEADKIIVEFNTDFLKSDKYKDLVERSYRSSSKTSSGRQNPFEPYDE